MTLRRQMVLGGILILLIPMVIVGLVTYLKTSRSLEEISRVQLVQIAQSLSGMIRIPLEKDLQILINIAKHPDVLRDLQIKEYRHVKSKLSIIYQMMGADYFEDIALFDRQGVVQVLGSNENRVGISIADRDYYIAARAGKPSVGTMVISKATGNPIFAICTPVFTPDGQFMGGMMGVIRADYLMQYVASMKLGHTGYAFMVDRAGVVIAHPEETEILVTDTTKEPGLDLISENMIAHRTGTVEYVFQGKRMVAGYTPVLLAGWSVAVAQEKKEIMAVAYANRDLILAVAAVFTVLTILAVFYLSSTISTPVQTKLATLDMAISQATEAFVIVGQDGKVRFANPAMAEIVGRSVPELIERPLHLARNGAMDNKDILEAILEGKSWTGHIDGRKKSGAPFTMDLSVTPVRTQTGKVICYLGVGRDISKELMLQERIQQSQKMEAIGTLAGGIAHDFNNILTAIFGYTELAIGNVNSPDRLEAFLTEILSASKRARDLVGRILAFSRKTDPDHKPIVPKFIIKEALELLRASLPSTIEIKSHLNSNAAILGNSTQLHQMTMNLCTNAGYEMKDQGGVLDINLFEKVIGEEELSQRPGIKPGLFLVLRVSDNGEGIPEQIRERIFDPFFTTKPTGEGTGLGLSVVHGIVQSLKGFITVASDPGQGTTFSIYLPTVTLEENIDQQDTGDQLPRGSERVLMVDDEAPIIAAGKHLMESLGYQVQTYLQSSKALEAFSENPDAFDVVLTDFTMPQMTGVELARNMRAIRADIPIIISSGYMDVGELSDIEPYEFVKKPVTRSELAHTLRRAVKQTRTGGGKEKSDAGA